MNSAAGGPALESGQIPRRSASRENFHRNRYAVPIGSNLDHPAPPMRFFQRLLEWLFIQPGQSDRYGDPDLYAVDTAKIAAEIDLEQEARRLGLADLPASGERSLSGVESLILRRAEKARQDFLSWGAEQLKVLNQDIERRDLAALINKASQADREFERQASGHLAEQERLLDDLATEAALAAAELRDFKARHRLNRPATYPDRAGTFFRYAVLALLVVVEGALNSVFFAQGLATGLVGGFVYAGSLAWVNVACAHGWGRWLLPNLNHRHPCRKLLGALALPAALATALAVGLLIAHFRDALAHDVEDAPRVAVESLRQAPLALREAHSWALFGVSLLFALVALTDSYGLDDPYPGYGAVVRRQRQAADDYGVELEAARHGLQALKDAALEELDRAVTEARTTLYSLHEAIERKAATEARLRNALADVALCLDGLLGTFRDHNKLHRQTPPPAYFSERPPLAELPWPDFSAERDRRKYAEQSARFEQLVESLEAMRGAIQSAFVRRRDGIEPLDAHFDASPERAA
jgi:hypothetical protein